MSKEIKDFGGFLPVMLLQIKGRYSMQGSPYFFVVEWRPRSSRQGKVKVFLRVGFSIEDGTYCA